jgi:hypothetical protein
MRRSFCFLFILQFIFSSALFSQPLDTVINPYDSVRSVVEQTVREYRDSLEREKLLQNIREKGKPLDTFLAERKEQERKEERRKWIRIGAGVIFLCVLLITSIRRYKKRRRP